MPGSVPKQRAARRILLRATIRKRQAEQREREQQWLMRVLRRQKVDPREALT